MNVCIARQFYAQTAMSDKSKLNVDGAAAAWFALPDLHLVMLTGADAARFAQAQFMNDVAALPAGHWHWNGWLTPKGRVIALFALIKRAGDEVWLLLLDAEPAAFCAALGRFVFRSKVRLDVPEVLHVIGAFAAPERARGNQAAERDDGTLELDFSADGGTRVVRVSSTPAPQHAAALERWRSFDLAHGLPRLAPEQSGQWTPQQLSLERLYAYSVHKGCYPGQEIVARTHFLGQAKRGLVRLVADAPLSPEAGVQVDDGAPVPLIARAGCDALAVLALEMPPSARYGVNGQPVARRDVLGGLGRSVVSG